MTLLKQQKSLLVHKLLTMAKTYFCVNRFSQHLKDFERYFPTLYLSIPGIPYSEHSSYLELKRFVQWLQPKKIIPTVNVGSWRSRKAMEGFFYEWQTEPRNLSLTPCAPRSSSCGTRQ